MITLKEIAAEAGVSMTTVSNVLHGKAKKVTPEVEERIKKAFGQIQLYPQIRAECSDQQGL